MTRRFATRHPHIASAVLTVVGVLLGAGLVLGLGITLGGCSVARQIPPAVATVDVAAERAIVAWFEEAAQQVEDDVAARHGTVEDWCEDVGPAHRTAQRVICAARALGDLALAGQEILDTVGADDPEWTEWLAAVPPLVVAVEDAFAAAGYEPPAAVARALRMLGGLMDLLAPGAAADVPCEVTEAPAECLHPGEGP